MYLKCIELIGFKSFAERTKLEFEPGMTAIVGPNGCGKSNVSDAIRWVLGEQSAKVLRGAKMEDVIFTGTDTHKPMGMAEVSLALADCEQHLGTQFNEVTITRRVFRSGEGEYFINKTPCRLKDIQRLFMDTGIGTDSYSLMEQGRIDQILSSRPDDRREVFEEASGITKYKADKKEAIRKLESTEANLLRLSDIIREVRRQIISLQRQVGKARRYKELQEKLRSYDLFFSRERLTALGRELQELEAQLAVLTEQEAAAQGAVAEVEEQSVRNREELSRTEQEISAAIDAAGKARADLERFRELIRVNQDRIRELAALSDRDTHEAAEADARLQQHRAALDALAQQVDEAAAAREAAEQELAVHTARLTAHEARSEELRIALNDLRNEAVALETQLTKRQNELMDLEARERTTLIRRERLAAEQAELQRALDIATTHQAGMTRTLADLQCAVDQQRELVQALSGQRAERAARALQLRQQMSQDQAQTAARQAQLDLLQTSEAEGRGFPGGARWLLDAGQSPLVDRSALLGSLAALFQTAPAYRTAIEAVLRAWMDAVVVRDEAAGLALLHAVAERAAGSVRLLALQAALSAPDIPAGAPGTPLLDAIACDDTMRPLFQRLLGQVRVVDRLDRIPRPLPAGLVLVTPAGALLRAEGSLECWLPESREATPIARRHQMETLRRELAELRDGLQRAEQAATALSLDDDAGEAALAQARQELEARQRNLALSQGESQVLAQQDKQLQQRVETVTWDLQALENQRDSGGDRRADLLAEMERLRARQADVRAALNAKQDALRALDQERSALFTQVSEHRVLFAERRQQHDHLAASREPLQARMLELEAVIRERTTGVSTYRARMDDLQAATRAAQDQLQPLELTVQQQDQRLAAAHARREENTAALTAVDAVLRNKRAALDELRRAKAKLDLEHAEQRMRCQNMADHVTGDYHITLDEVMVAPEPAWENGVQPEREALETTMAEIRARMESMGPVNLVAIEEHQELEARYNFLIQQQDDLSKAKQQLMDLIKRINKTTTEMFAKTFDQVNQRFQDMFHKLFGGGTAKLVLVDEEDVLESGIEIIARPPGKKLQTVSLLSGGERTLTAVALLFALYLVKPSPFCLLDELDAALDESNIGRFIQVLQDFVTQSQFIVITHNRQTIGAADVLYGVTMEQRGISKIVSVKFNQEKRGEGGRALEFSRPAPPPPPPEPRAAPPTPPAKPVPEPVAVAASPEESVPEAVEPDSAVEPPPAAAAP